MGRAAAKEAEGEQPRPIIIKKVKKGGHGHHGGSWKVAFADFATFDSLFNSDGTWGTVERFSEHHPQLSRLYLGSSALVFVVALALALGRRGGARARPSTPGRSAWVPAAVLVLVNACAFALVADLVHVRYVLFAHVALLALVYSRAGAAPGADRPAS